jgi:hypothetical protein
MSDFTAIRAVSASLQALLEDHITHNLEPQLNGVPIDLRSPKEMLDDNNAVGISLWLYRIARDGSTLNNLPERPRPNQELRPPIPVNLYYLVTPMVHDAEARQALIGRVVQTLNDHPRLSGTDLQDTLTGSNQELRISFDPLPMEELARFWTALQDSFQLCVSYEVQLVTIDSDHEPMQTPPVMVKDATYSRVLSVS